mgnify:FL=1
MTYFTVEVDYGDDRGWVTVQSFTKSILANNVASKLKGQGHQVRVVESKED